MKQTLTFFAAILLLAVGATAQKLSYQAVVRNDANELVAGATVQVTVSILNATGDVQYAENHANVQTNLNGLLSLMIGDGTPTGTATMADVVWTGASVRTVITLPGGASVTSVTPVNAVPYALYADNVDPSVVEDAVTDYIAAHGAGGEANVQADWNVTDPTSDAYIQNKPVNVSAFNNNAGYITAADIPAQANADWEATSGVAQILNKPTGVSAFDNDANYITAADIPAIPTVPADVSAFNNDANYITNTGSCANSVDLCALLNRLAVLENQLEPIVIQTEGVTAVNEHSFTVNGKVLTDGSTSINQRGFVYATSHNPTLDNNSVNNGSGTGEYTSTITELTAGTTYFVRAFATNVNGTYYGNEVAVTTTATTPSVLPSVTTITVTNVTTSEATVRGAVTSDGGENVTQRGFVYGTEPNLPIASSSIVYHGTGVGQYVNLLSSLLSGQTYYVRAFATNSVGTAYGDELTFTTSTPSPVAGDAVPCPETPTVTDHEGNVYNTVQIGTQCWTKENLRTTTSPSTGTYLIPPAGTSHTCSGKQARWYNDDSTTYAPRNYGLLYNWLAATDTFNVEYGETSMNGNNGFDVFFEGNRRGICPQGWHLPSHDEWTILTDYLNSHEEYQSGGIAGYTAKAIAATIDWQENNTPYAVGNDLNANNVSGFSALPAGQYWINDDAYVDVYGGTSFWSTTNSNNGAHAKSRYFSAWMATIDWHDFATNMCSCVSVRCLRDETGGSGSSALLPAVTTIAVTNITTNGATVQGEVTSDGGESVTERGICWCTNDQGNPTLEHNHVTAGSGIGTFNATIGNLAEGHYHVCAYATNAAGTAYGNVLSITICNDNTTSGLPCSGTPTVTDYEGHVYNTVMIGEQCWMRENLRSLHYADGTQIDYGAYESSYYPSTVYYLDVAVMNGAESSNNIPSGVQGPCPNGWHLPSKAEWEVLISYVSNQFSCYADSLSILYASPEGWPGHNGNLNPGYNRTGFSATPSGTAYYGAVEGEVNYSVFSSCTRLPDPSDFYVFNVNIDENRAEIAGGHPGWYTVAVRCLRDY